MHARQRRRAATVDLSSLVEPIAQHQWAVMASPITEIGRRHRRGPHDHGPHGQPFAAVEAEPDAGAASSICRCVQPLPS